MARVVRVYRVEDSVEWGQQVAEDQCQRFQLCVPRGQAGDKWRLGTRMAGEGTEHLEACNSNVQCTIE